MTAREEQETTSTVMRDDALAYVFTSNLPDLRKLRALSASTDFVTEVRGGDDWGEFTVRSENFNPLMAIRRKRPRSAAQVEAARAAGVRLAAQREAVSS